LKTTYKEDLDMKKKLSAVVISITPFDQQGRVDEAAFRRQLARLRDAGVSVYVAGSGSSEAYTLTPEERDRVLAIAVEELKGKVPFRAMGCEPRLVSEMVDFMRCAERAKVDAAQIFSLEIGHGAKPTVAEMDKYYSTVIESTSLAIYLSSHTASGYVLPLDLVENLVNRHPTIAGIAYGGSDVGYLAELIARVGDKIEVHCAGPFNAAASLALGGNGFMGGEGNFSPTLVASVIAAFETRDMGLFRESFRKLLAFAEINNRYGKGGSSVRALKPLMNAFGLPGGTLRPPRLPISASELDKMVKEVLRLKIPGIPPLATETART
jgi:4-hydroxy-tetrahydrodipicolinate synthase